MHYSSILNVIKMKRLLSGIFIILLSSFSYAQRVFTLDDCCRIAVENNKKIKLSDFSIKQAELQEKNVAAGFLPKLSASGGYLYANKDFSMELAPSLSAALDISNTYFAGVQLEQPVYMGGKIIAARNMSEIGTNMAVLNRKKNDSEIRIETEEAYWNVIKAKELYEVSIKYKNLVEELFNNIEKMNKTGMSPRNELLKVQVKLNEANLSMKRSENAIRLSKMALCHIMGIPLTDDIEISGTIEFEPAVFRNDEFIIENRSEYKLLSENINLKKEQIKSVRSDYLPRIGLVAGYNYIDGVRMNGHKFLKDDIFSVMLAVKIPLFHWGEGHRKIKSAKIELQKAEVMRDEMIEKMQLEVTRNYNILNEAELEVELTENAFSYAEENLQESSKSFETGMETLANFLEAQASWQKAYFEVISAKTNYHIAKSKYLNSIGGL